MLGEFDKSNCNLQFYFKTENKSCKNLLKISVIPNLVKNSYIKRQI